MEGAVGRRVKLELEDGTNIDGYVHSFSANTGKLSLDKVECVENGKRKKVVGIQHYFADEINNFVITEDVNHRSKKKKTSKSGAGSMLKEKYEPSHLNRLNFVEKSSMVLKSDKKETIVSGSDSDSDVLQSSDDYTLISKLCPAFYEAVEYIRKFQVIALGMEGIAIGRFGRLCWLQLAVPRHVYLFDVLKMGRTCFEEGIKAILEDDGILKVLHDCRMPSDLLHHQYGINLINVFDTQVANVFVYRLTHHNDWPRHVEGLAACLLHHLDLPLEELNFATVREKRQEEDEAVWMERPPQRHLVDAAMKNVKHLLELRNVLMEKMMEEYVAGVNIYLMHVRDASDNDSKRYRTTSHLLPVAFQDIRVFMSSYHGRNPHFSTSNIPKDPYGFRENCSSLIQPGVYYSKDSIWHGGVKKTDKSLPQNAQSILEANKATEPVTEHCRKSSEPESNDKDKRTPRHYMSLLELQKAVSKADDTSLLPSSRKDDCMENGFSEEFMTSHKNIQRSSQCDTISQVVESMNASRLAGEVCRSTELTERGWNSLGEIQEHFVRDTTDTSKLSGSGLMRALVHAQDASGYESHVNIDKFSLKPAGQMVPIVNSKKKNKSPDKQDKVPQQASLVSRMITNGNSNSHSQCSISITDSEDDLKSLIPGGDLNSRSLPPGHCPLTLWGDLDSRSPPPRQCPLTPGGDLNCKSPPPHQCLLTPGGELNSRSLPPRQCRLTPQEQQLIDQARKKSPNHEMASVKETGDFARSLAGVNSSSHHTMENRKLRHYLDSLKMS